MRPFPIPFRPLAALVGLVLLAGCARRLAEAPGAMAVPPPQAEQARSLAAAGYLSSGAEAAPNAAAPAAPDPGAVWAALKLIRTGRIEIEVDDVGEAIAELERLAAGSGGFVAGTELREDDGGHASGTITLKIPSDRYDAAVAGLRSLGRVRSESSSVEDVTKAYADLETRLAVKRRTEERLRALLATRTGELSELLEVERELDRVVGEIEQLLGERRWYDQRISLSTLVVALWEPRAIVRPSAFTPIREALRDALEVLAASIAFLLYATVFLLPWSLVAWAVVALVRRRLRRRAARRAAASGQSSSSSPASSSG